MVDAISFACLYQERLGTKIHHPIAKEVSKSTVGEKAKETKYDVLKDKDFGDDINLKHGAVKDKNFSDEINSKHDKDSGDDINLELEVVKC
uniref:Uncharacterized protein n=1 Tax=Rhizophora mucronata TaxID=61149 RepID=A0A2P2QGE6_RHIMU